MKKSLLFIVLLGLSFTACSEKDIDDNQEAIEEFEGDYDEEEIRLYRIKFTNEVAN